MDESSGLLISLHPQGFYSVNCMLLIFVICMHLHVSFKLPSCVIFYGSSLRCNPLNPKVYVNNISKFNLYCISITETNKLMLFQEEIAVCHDNYVIMLVLKL